MTGRNRGATSVPERLAIFAVAAPGLEPVVAAELEALGIAGSIREGGVEWEGTREELYAANLWLRTATRVLVRLGAFRARAFYELERHARRLPWERVLTPGRAVRLRVSSRRSRLYHERAIAERFLEAIERKVGRLGATAVQGAEEEDGGGDAQLIVVRFFEDRCLVSADSSGELLHRRGYRQAVAKAPLRETLAAAMLLASGWHGQAPLVDPLCGSGTIPIEAALIARRIAPGLANAARTPRRYAFQEWPDYDAGLWARAVERAAEQILPASPVPLHGSDRNGGAIRAARGNAERAGVLSDVTLVVRPLSTLEPPEGPGWLVTNPPYGVRVGVRATLGDLYASLGDIARRKLPGWTLALLSPDRRLDAQLGLELAEAFRTRTGGLAVRLLVGKV